MRTRGALLLTAFALTATQAFAQTPPTSYKLTNQNFDMWCQETKHYPPERCDKRLPEDDAEFKEFRQTVETYELQRLQQQRQGQELDQGVLHNDPVSNENRPPNAPGSEGTIPNPPQ
jgi:hypothetical protein